MRLILLLQESRIKRRANSSGGIKSTTFLIDKEGKNIEVNKTVQVDDHANQILKLLNP